MDTTPDIPIGQRTFFYCDASSAGRIDRIQGTYRKLWPKKRRWTRSHVIRRALLALETELQQTARVILASSPETAAKRRQRESLLLQATARSEAATSR